MHVIGYFDYGSPYSYLAWQRACLQPDRFPIEWIPVSHGHIAKMEGAPLNRHLPNLWRYNQRDLQRFAEALGVPLVIPETFPAYSLLAARIQLALPPEQQAAWMQAVMDAHWTLGQDIGDRDVLAALAGPLGLSESLDAMDDPDAKAALAATTKQAYDAGAPGVPYFVVDGQGFWGQDRMDWVAARAAHQEVSL